MPTGTRSYLVWLLLSNTNQCPPKKHTMSCEGFACETKVITLTAVAAFSDGLFTPMNSLGGRRLLSIIIYGFFLTNEKHVAATHPHTKAHETKNEQPYVFQGEVAALNALAFRTVGLLWLGKQETCYILLPPVRYVLYQRMRYGLIQEQELLM